jgi:transposase-like protein
LEPRPLSSADGQSVQAVQQFPEAVRLTVSIYIRYPVSLRNVEDRLAERGIDICHKTVRLWHLDEVFVKISGITHYLWRAVDHEGMLLKSLPQSSAIGRQCSSSSGSSCDNTAAPLAS